MTYGITYSLPFISFFQHATAGYMEYIYNSNDVMDLVFFIAFGNIIWEYYPSTSMISGTGTRWHLFLTCTCTRDIREELRVFLSEKNGFFKLLCRFIKERQISWPTIFCGSLIKLFFSNLYKISCIFVLDEKENHYFVVIREAKRF